MSDIGSEWHPGSFTKNAGWGRPSQGFKLLHEIINVGFDGQPCDVPRSLFRARIRKIGKPDYIPINFFLFNKTIDNKDHIIVDELVFNALFFEHSRQFDNLAMLAFIITYVGHWKGAKPYQSRPALWAHNYISEQVAQSFNWDTSKISADDIENYVSTNSRYKAKTARKLATNLNYYFQLGDLASFSSNDVSRWWVDSVFLALDRVIEHRTGGSLTINLERLSDYLTLSNFHGISGRRGIEKDLSIKHLLKLYDACGGRTRFDPDAVEKLTKIRLPNHTYARPNDQSPIAAIHSSNPRLIKTLTKECTMLARYVANFTAISVEELENFRFDEFVAENFETAMSKLQERKIKPGMDAQTLLKIIRD